MVHPKLQKKQQVRRPFGAAVTYFCCGGRSNILSCFAVISLAVSMILFLPWKFAKDVITNQSAPSVSQLPPWKEGYLDIHHIHAGVNVATFLIFPDGTTMLIDCGDLDIAKFNQKYGKATALYPKLDVVSPYPNQSKTTGQWVIDYIHHFWPNTADPAATPNYSNTNGDNTNNIRRVIDIMMITHFHQDHIGSIYTADQHEQKKGTRGDYIRTGIVEVGDDIDFTTIIDRGYPKYDFPFDLEQDWESAPFLNYLNFVRTSLQRGSTKTVEQFQVGNYTQIGLRNVAQGTTTGSTPFGHFRIRNIKANLEYSYATPEDHEVKTIPGKLLHPAPKRKSGYTYDENKVSAAIVIEYGNFRYYEGGDQEYHNDGYPSELPDEDGSPKYELDTVTPTAQMAGPVHVATLNHHGHGVLKAFCDILNPKVLILQGWCTDQPPNHSMETLLQHQQDKPADLFTTWISEERLDGLRQQKKSLRNMFKSTVGHVVVRVEPLLSNNNNNQNENDDEIDQEQKYHVYILDGNRHVNKYFGPYDA